MSIALLSCPPGTALTGARAVEWFDPTGIPRPAVARLHDFWLGRLCHWSTERRLADAVTAVWPDAAHHIRAEHLWYRRTIIHLLDRGIRQVVDIGCGLVHHSLIHHLAATRATAPVRAVYVEADPVATAYNTGRLAQTAGARAVHADPVTAAILDRPDVACVLDLAEPTAVVLRNLHHLRNHDLAALLAGLADAVAPGSYLAMSGLCTGPDLDVAALTGLYLVTPTGLHLYHPEQIYAAIAAVARLGLVPPGLVAAHTWHPDRDDPGPPAPALLAGLARLDPG